ncbi:endoribonuclease L-PSP [Aulographum hederae CBS 113979]|uniref:Endoribonuclease L-PSP n=1 Tax=Aulographum hederae CBS 113979 TaxID=1176131 RepID=A0A6G1HAY3_9PEZI|nr:endoribonuclease L-PSP [Aulographum hederae CBS 113979]
MLRTTLRTTAIAQLKLRPVTSFSSQLRQFNNTSTKMADMKKIFTANACPPAGPYTQAIATGNIIFVSGQIPADKEGNLVEGSIAQKTESCCKNVIAILEEAGSDISRVVKTTVFLDDMANFAEMNGVYEKFFAHKPARSCVAVKQLPKGVPVEIECIALSKL